jgi:predicted transcriptional regulator
MPQRLTIDTWALPDSLINPSSAITLPKVDNIGKIVPRSYQDLSTLLAPSCYDLAKILYLNPARSLQDPARTCHDLVMFLP